MKKHLTQLAVIYSAAVVTGVFAFSYISHGIDALTVKPITPQANTVVTANLQGSVLDTYRLQPATNTVQGRDVNPQANQTGGNGQNEELQPAMGYGALNEVIQ